MSCAERRPAIGLAPCSQSLYQSLLAATLPPAAARACNAAWPATSHCWSYGRQHAAACAARYSHGPPCTATELLQPASAAAITHIAPVRCLWPTVVYWPPAHHGGVPHHARPTAWRLNICLAMPPTGDACLLPCATIAATLHPEHQGAHQEACIASHRKWRLWQRAQPAPCLSPWGRRKCRHQETGAM